MNRLVQVVGFGALTCALYALAILVLGRWTTPDGPLVMRTADYYERAGFNTWQRFHEYSPAQHHDVLVIGSSHAYRGYDPAVFAEHGYSMFTLGSDMQAPLNTYYLIRAYIDSIRAPLVIMDVCERTMGSSGLECLADLSPSLPDAAPLMGTTWALHDPRGVNMLALHLLAPQHHPYKLDPTYAGNGFASKPDSIGPRDGELPVPFVINQRQEEYFADCISLCRERGIKLVISSHFARRNLRGPFHEPLAAFVQRTMAGSGIPYLDFTNARGTEDANWFADESHLNLTGARIFTEQLVDSLQSLGYLPVKRNAGKTSSARVPDLAASP